MLLARASGVNGARTEQVNLGSPWRRPLQWHPAKHSRGRKGGCARKWAIKFVCNTDPQLSAGTYNKGGQEIRACGLNGQKGAFRQTECNYPKRNLARTLRLKLLLLCKMP